MDEYTARNGQLLQNVLVTNIPLKRPTIKDVAKLAGVSFKTVSRVINHSPNIKDEMRQKVGSARDRLAGVSAAL